MFLKDRVAIITGAGGGLGRAHALYLAREGAKVCVNDLGNGAIEVAQEIKAAGGEAIGVVGSVADVAAVAKVVATTLDRWGRIDILVNNAGILRDVSFGKMTLDDFRVVVEVHLMGTVICTKAVWAAMKAQNYGRIVLTTSASGLFGNFGQANYGAAKMALVGLMQTLGLEGAKNNIRVNALAPTAATAMTSKIMPDVVKPLLAPELVSPALLKLCGEDAPDRAILCAGAGHFARAYVTLTQGAYVGADDDAGNSVIARWDSISDPTEQTIPESVGAQVERELANAAEARS